MKCAVCGKGPGSGVSVFRMNKAGQKGLWACNEHKDHFDGRTDQNVKDVVDSIESALKGGA